MTIGEQKFLWYELVSFGYKPKSSITCSCGRLIPNFLRNNHSDFHISCTSLHSYQKWRCVTLTLNPLQHRLSSVFMILSILTGVIWYLRVVLIFISFIRKDVEHFLKCLLAFWDSSVENSMFRSVCTPFFKLDYLVIWCLVSWVLCIFWRSALCQMGWQRSSPIL